MRRKPTSLTLTAAALLFAGCSSTAARNAYVAPTGETIVSTTEERESDPPTHLIFIENHSTVPVTVFSVSLSGCENVKGRCSPQPVNLRVGPSQRTLALRVEPASLHRSFSYHFGFSWRADSSSSVALQALGTRHSELTRDELTAIAPRVESMRAEPESLVLEPGTRANLGQVRFLLADNQGQILGRTRWVQWMVSSSSVVQFLPPDNLIALRLGRTSVRFSIAEDAQKILTSPIADIEYPVIVAYPSDPHAPVFTGIVVDEGSKAPLACVQVALEDSAQNVVATERTDATGAFRLKAPRPGTYRVRAETFGWAPVHSPSEMANADETKQREHAVSFTEQLLVFSMGMEDQDFKHAYPAAVSTEPIGPPRTSGAKPAAATPVVQGVTLGGSATTPILGIIARVPPGTTWIQFVVDSAGRVDTGSLLFPPGTHKAAVASVTSVLPRVRFSPARDAGNPICEMLRMQVNFSAR